MYQGCFAEMSGEGKKFSSVENFTIGAALVYVMASAPLERIKLMLQSQNEMLKADWLQKPYKGIVDCAIRIYRTEGTRKSA